MSNLKKNKSLLAILIIQIGIILLAVGNYILCKSSLYNTTVYPDELVENTLVTDDGILYANSNVAEGAIATTPALTLSRGSYVVYINYDTDTAGNSISAYATSIPSHKFICSPAQLQPTEKTASLRLRINGSGEVYLQTNYCGNGMLQISEFSVHETTDMAKQDFIHACILCAVISLIYYIYTASLDRRKTIFALGAIIFLSSYPLMVNYLVAGHDLPFHLVRIDAIKTGLENNVFPVKIHPVWTNGYGYAIGVFYGDALLYIPALLRLFSLPVQNAYQLFVLMVNTATVLISYFSFHKILNNRKISLLGTLLYTVSLYRLQNLYTRGSVGEYCAMIFLPLILVGFYNIFTQDKNSKKWWQTAILPALGITGVIHTHVLSCIIVAFFILLTCIILYKKTFKSKVFLSLLFTLGITLLLNAGFIVPFMDYYFTEEFIMHTASWTGARDSQNFGLFGYQIFSIFQNNMGGNWSTVGGIANEFNPGLGAALTIGFIGSLYILFTTKQKNKSLFQLGMLYSALSLFMSSYIFPWSTIANWGVIGKSIASNIQFPWRLLSVGTLFVTLSVCLALKHYFSLAEEQEDVKKIKQSRCIILLCLCAILTSGWFYHTFLSIAEPYRVYETSDLPDMQIYSSEYLPADTELNKITYNRYFVTEDILVSSINKQGTDILCHIENNGNDGYLEVPLTNYKGYQAIYKETGEKLSISNGENNCIRIEIPSGFNGTLDIAFHEPIYWRIAELVSTLTVLSLIVISIVGTLKYKKAKTTMFETKAE